MNTYSNIKKLWGEGREREALKICSREDLEECDEQEGRDKERTGSLSQSLVRR